MPASAARSEAQALAPDAMVQLYELDTSRYGGPIYAWTPGPLGEAAVIFSGVSYTPVPLQIDGLAMDGQGPIPRPKVTIPNIGGFASQLMAASGDLLGCQVTRRRTFRKFLDGQPGADSTAFFGPDMWYVDRVALRGPDVVSFELAAAMDIVGKMIPGRQVIRDSCTHVYRTYRGSAFVTGTCPYAGGSYFKADGISTAQPAEDVCGKRLSDCRKRFPDGALPTRAFPGATQVRF